MATNDWFFAKPKTFWSKSKKENIIEHNAKKCKDMPAPNHYKLDTSWVNNKKCEFLKGEKITIIDDIIKL